jgi:hypothetical protein
MKVVLPAPFAPSRPKASPGAIVSVTPSSASVSPKRRVSASASTRAPRFIASVTALLGTLRSGPF